MCGAPKPRKKIATKEKVKMDFRRADPKYVNFVPKTCVDAIDLFNRHRNLGLTADMFPECFVHCSRSLPNEELDKFHRFIICPSGDVNKGGEKWPKCEFTSNLSLLVILGSSLTDCL